MARISERWPGCRHPRAAAAVLTAAALGLSGCVGAGPVSLRPSATPLPAGPAAAAVPAAPTSAAAVPLAPTRAAAVPVAPTAAAAAPLAPTPAAPAPALRLTPVVKGRLDRAVQRVLREVRAPGVVVGLWTPQGRYVRAFGVADKATREPMNPRMGFRIGSETKTFTVTALLQLVDRGLARLDDPVSRYVSGVPGGDRITLRQLAGMRSGLYSYTVDPDFDRALVTDPRRTFTPRQLLGYAFRHPATARPGTVYEYSNTNTVLLGLVVERLGGLPLGEYLRRYVLAPGGLRRTFFPTGPGFPAPHAHGYTVQTPTGRVADATDWNPSWAWAAGAVTSDLDDLRTWAGVLARGGLLRPGTQAQRLALRPTGYPGTGYGLGLFGVNGWIGHNGSLPGYESVAVYLPPARATLVVLVNSDILRQGAQPGTLFAEAVTRVVTPGHVYTLPSASPTARPSAGARLRGRP